MTQGEAAPANGSPAARRGDKSPAAFRTTGELADELDLPAHVLRFWESKFPQVKPLKRGGGRRYYRPQDVDLLRRIRQCLYEHGYTIRGVQKLLRDGGLPGGEAMPPPAEGGRPALAPEPPGDVRENAAEAALNTRELRAALEEVRRELAEIRAVLGKMGLEGEPGSL